MANPNPDTSGLVNWQPGQSGNPGGKTSEQKQREMRNAEMATKLQEFMLEREIAAISNPVDVGVSKAVHEALSETLPKHQLDIVLSTLNVALTTERLKLIKDAQDRGLGAPVQPVDADIRTKDISDIDRARWVAFVLEKGARDG